MDEFGFEFGEFLRTLGVVDEVVPFAGVGFEVVEFRLVSVGAAVAVGVVDVFPIVGADAADVGRVGELLFVVVFVEPGFPPGGVLAFGERFPGHTVDVLEGLGTAEVENAGGEIDVERPAPRRRFRRGIAFG